MKPLLAFLLTLLCFSSADAQVYQTKDDYGHNFIYTSPGDTTRRILSFHRRWKTDTREYIYSYDDLSFRTEPYVYGSQKRRLADELPYYDTLLRAALQTVSLDSVKYLDVGGPLAWRDILEKQTEVFSRHPVWKKKNVKTTPEQFAYKFTDSFMVEGHVYQIAEDWLAPYGWRISGMQCSKIGYFGPKLLKKEGIEYTGGPMIPVPYEFGIDLRKKR